MCITVLCLPHVYALLPWDSHSLLISKRLPGMERGRSLVRRGLIWCHVGNGGCEMMSLLDGINGDPLISSRLLLPFAPGPWRPSSSRTWQGRYGRDGFPEKNVDPWDPRRRLRLRTFALCPWPVILLLVSLPQRRHRLDAERSRIVDSRSCGSPTSQVLWVTPPARKEIPPLPGKRLTRNINPMKS